MIPFETDVSHKGIRGLSYTLPAICCSRDHVMSEQDRPAWCPRGSQAGDVIAVLAGGTVPLVLRKTKNGGYRLVRDAHVYGLVDGEAVDRLESSGRDWEDMTLV